MIFAAAEGSSLPLPGRNRFILGRGQKSGGADHFTWHSPPGLKGPLLAKKHRKKAISQEGGRTTKIQTPRGLSSHCSYLLWSFWSVRAEVLASQNILAYQINLAVFYYWGGGQGKSGRMLHSSITHRMNASVCLEIGWEDFAVCFHARFPRIADGIKASFFSSSIMNVLVHVKAE